MFSGMHYAVRPSVRPYVSVAHNTYFARHHNSVRSGGISMKLGTNIHHKVGIAEKVFKVVGQKSRL